MNAHLWGRRAIEVICAVDIEQTPRSFHAHAIPLGIDLRPGDVVQLKGEPFSIDFDQSIRGNFAATVLRAGWLVRFWIRFISILSVTQLFETGFDDRESL